MRNRFHLPWTCSGFSHLLKGKKKKKLPWIATPITFPWCRQIPEPCQEGSSRVRWYNILARLRQLICESEELIPDVFLLFFCWFLNRLREQRSIFSGGSNQVSWLQAMPSNRFSGNNYPIPRGICTLWPNCPRSSFRKRRRLIK